MRCELRELTIYRECVQHRARDSPLDWELRHICLRKQTTLLAEYVHLHSLTIGQHLLTFSPLKTSGGKKMAKAVRGLAGKAAARNHPVPVKRKASTPHLTSDKFKALVDNLTTTELDELIKSATGRKYEQIAGAGVSFLDEVKARAASLGMSPAELVGLGRGTLAKSQAAHTARLPNIVIQTRERHGRVVAARRNG
jgi:hypothetical protein